MLQLTSTQPRRVVIAGGGVAAVETLLALRAAPGGSAFDVTVMAPGPELVYRPLAVNEPFGRPTARRYALATICDDLGATLVPEALIAVTDDRHALGGDGASLPCEALVLATGARPEIAIEHAFTFFADSDAEKLEGIVRELEEGLVRTIAFVVPPGAGWPLPLYELALLTARRAWAIGAADVELTLVTPEEAPLAVFRGTGSEAVGRLLSGAGIALECGSYAHSYDGHALRLTPGDRSLEADRVVALPRLRGPALAGVPCDRDGFVRVDEHGRVPGLPGVWAVGDATTSAIKQGGLASQQADAVAGGDRPRDGLLPSGRRAAADAARDAADRRGPALPDRDARGRQAPPPAPRATAPGGRRTRSPPATSRPTSPTAARSCQQAPPPDAAERQGRAPARSSARVNASTWRCGGRDAVEQLQQGDGEEAVAGARDAHRSRRDEQRELASGVRAARRRRRAAARARVGGELVGDTAAVELVGDAAAVARPSAPPRRAHAGGGEGGERQRRRGARASRAASPRPRRGRARRPGRRRRSQARPRRNRGRSLPVIDSDRPPIAPGMRSASGGARARRQAPEGEGGGEGGERDGWRARRRAGAGRQRGGRRRAEHAAGVAEQGGQRIAGARQLRPGDRSPRASARSRSAAARSRRRAPEHDQRRRLARRRPPPRRAPAAAPHERPARRDERRRAAPAPRAPAPPAPCRAPAAPAARPPAAVRPPAAIDRPPAQRRERGGGERVGGDDRAGRERAAAARVAHEQDERERDRRERQPRDRAGAGERPRRGRASSAP